MIKSSKFSIKGALLIIVVAVFIASINFFSVQAGRNDYRSYLPIIERQVYHGFATDNKFLGIYMAQYWTNSTVPTYMPVADNLAGKKHAVSGWFISFQNIAFTTRQGNINTNNFYRQLEALWINHYVSFVNLTSASSVTDYDVQDNCPIPFNAYQVARGDCDRAIQKMADLYHQWISLGGGRKAFLAPFPEMNGVNADGSSWTSYGGDPGNFKLAYQRIIDIFAQKGVTLDQVWWTFAPNGWSKSGNEFEIYYPGDNTVDVVGFSMYNYGWCSVANPWEKWENYNTLYAPYIARIGAMAPAKPVIIAQTGTTAQYGSAQSFNIDAKNSWLQENYEYLSDQPSVLGVLYYDLDLSSWECNWQITGADTFKPGYAGGATSPSFKELTWQDLESIIP